MTEEKEIVAVIDNPEEDRFEVHVDGRLAGFADYRLSPTTVDFTHTEIADEFGGRGLAKTLATEALDEVRGRGLAVQPHCEFFAGFIKKNPDYLDLVPEGRREEFDLA